MASALMTAHSTVTDGKIMADRNLLRHLPTTSLLYEDAIKNAEARLAPGGALVVSTLPYTGRSAGDKFLVRDASTDQTVDWGAVNQPFSEERFERLLGRVDAYLQGRPLYVIEAVAGADPACNMGVRVVTERAWHALFTKTMMLPAADSTAMPEFTILHAPGFHADPEIDGTKSDVFIVVNLTRRIALIGGTEYGGEIKKTIFSVANYYLPGEGVFSMHCSANAGAAGDVALFFGLSGTGKTTLSADPERRLIGDDEHGWSDRGIFNIEGGCYAKAIHLSQEAEPEIFATTSRFGTILENVTFDDATGELDLDDDSTTENTRAAYPISFIPNHVADGLGGHPAHIIMLTADAFGVLPPVARLNPDQAKYHFLSGYTAKVAGTERGVDEPEATFSACFGSPFLPLAPVAYADLLGERIERDRARVWLVNTGWTGGPYGVGTRMPIAVTRGIVRSILAGDLDEEPMTTHPVFGIAFPTSVSGLPSDLLDQRATWTDGAAYDAQAAKLARMFVVNFEQFRSSVSADVFNAGPRGQ